MKIKTRNKVEGVHGRGGWFEREKRGKRRRVNEWDKVLSISLAEIDQQPGRSVSPNCVCVCV